MRIIPTRVHGMMDYLMGALLVIAPWLFNFRSGPETWIPVVVGLGAAGYSLMTRYEMGLVGLIPMPVHLALDTGAGAFLAASPWIFGFAEHVWLPHVAFGIAEVGAALLTRTVPETVARGSLAA